MTRPYHQWKMWEINLVKRHYGPLSCCPWPTRRLAQELGRSEHSVREAARRSGMCFMTIRRASHRRLMHWYGKGLTDRKIAFQMDCCLKTVWTWRTRMGLPKIHPSGRKPWKNQPITVIG